jgi:hypothetical protein
VGVESYPPAHWEATADLLSYSLVTMCVDKGTNTPYSCCSFRDGEFPTREAADAAAKEYTPERIRSDYLDQLAVCDAADRDRP